MLGRYADGDRVLDASDKADLEALLAVYDSVVPDGQSTKTGAGVAHFERRSDRGRQCIVTRSPITSITAASLNS